MSRTSLILGLAFIFILLLWPRMPNGPMPSETDEIRREEAPKVSKKRDPIETKFTAPNGVSYDAVHEEVPSPDGVGKIHIIRRREDGLILGRVFPRKERLRPSRFRDN